MIVPMKKLDVLIYHQDKEEFLHTLRDAGVFHIKEKTETPSEKIIYLMDKQKKINKVLGALKTNSKSIEQKQNENPEDIIEQYDKITTKIDKCEQEILIDNKLIEELTPWGEFDPASIRRLIDNGLSVKLLYMSSKKFDALDKENMAFEIINSVGSTTYFMLVERGEEVEIDVDETPNPEFPLSSIIERVGNLQNELMELQKSCKKLAVYFDILNDYAIDIRQKLELESARISMEEGKEGKILALSGWFPVDEEKVINDSLENFSCWHEATDPHKGEAIPVKLKNKNGFDLFKPLTAIFSLPDYFELDPTPFFAPFYALFFGLCLGDLGYGFVLMLAAGIAMMKVSKKLKPIMMLGVVLGISTMISGTLLNTVFGAPIFGEIKTGAFSMAILAPRSDLPGFFPAMPFSIFIGLVQVVLGMTLKAVNRYKEGGFQFTLYPFGTILLTIATACSLVKINFLDMALFWEIAFPEYFAENAIANALSWTAVLTITGIGLGLVFLFNNPEKKFMIRLPLGLWELYNFSTGIMGDGLSYIRLFALGLAGGLLGAAFNQIAFMLITNNGVVKYNSFLIVFTILILILGHTINFLLAAIGSFVHPLRLTFVEFYNNLEFKGGSKPFKPFRKTEKIIK